MEIKISIKCRKETFESFFCRQKVTLPIANKSSLTR
jgi:hypothetical protein